MGEHRARNERVGEFAIAAAVEKAADARERVEQRDGHGNKVQVVGLGIPASLNPNGNARKRTKQPAVKHHAAELLDEVIRERGE